MKKKSFAVIGLGSFGRSIANQLLDLHAEVLLIDNKRTSNQCVY
jgi:Trk K+ transport system NAD-binding subunit